MSSLMSMGAVAAWLILHLVLMLGTAAYQASESRSCGDTVDVQSWACGSPLEPLIAAQPQETDFFGKAARAAKAAFVLGFRMFALDYDLLKGDGMIDGGIGLFIRFFGWTAATVASAGIALRMFGRG